MTTHAQLVGLLESLGDSILDLEVALDDEAGRPADLTAVALDVRRAIDAIAGHALAIAEAQRLARRARRGAGAAAQWRSPEQPA